jgi:LacI family transcriptional regulator
MSMSRGARQPTIKEVATRAGVSPMTVSRTLAGGRNVRPDVQERVMAAVRELGYYRNENARSLRPGQPSGLIGVAITNLANPYYGNFALGVEEVAAAHGRRIILGNTGEDDARERQLVSDFIGRQVDGLILVPTSGGDAEHLRPERLGEVPLVLASRRVPGLEADTVLLDDVGGAYRGTLALLDAGHTRIGFLGNRSSVFTGERRYRGYERAMLERGAPIDPAIVARDQQDVSAATKAARAMLDLEEPPTAIFSANNRNSIGVMREIGRRMRDGLPGPRPDVVSFDDFELSELMPVPVTVIDHDARLLGREAATLLFSRLEGGTDEAPRTVELPVTIESP